MYYNSVHAFIIPSRSPLRCYFPRKELIKHTKHFMHPSTGKVLNLLKRAYPSKASEKIRRLRQTNADNFENCFKHAFTPFRFRSFIPRDQIIFNRELSKYLMSLNGKPVLHILETETGFQNDLFTGDKTAERLWTIFINCWTSVCIKFPEIVQLDRYTSFTSM